LPSSDPGISRNPKPVTAQMMAKTIGQRRERPATLDDDIR
jgi:hypothetical protein